MNTPRYLNWLKKVEESLKTIDGKDIEVYEFNHDSDENILSEWAAHFRQQYCDDSLIDRLKAPNQTREDYLLSVKFPDEKKAPGPSIRTGDFSEILIADFVEFTKNYWVPRTRYNNKTIRNESTKGSDVIGFKLKNPDSFSSDDCLLIVEVKAGFSNNKKNYYRLQDAVNDSGKDFIRKAESLNAMKQIFLNKPKEFAIIERFQQEVDNPYKQIYGASALFDNNVFKSNEINKTDCSQHKKKKDLRLLVISGLNMSDLVNLLYKKAANEA